MNEAGINNLRIAILGRAITDYKDINSEYFNTLYFDIGYSGKDIINIIRKEVEDEKYI